MINRFQELDLLKQLEKLQAVVKLFRREKPFLVRVPLTVWQEIPDEELGLDGALTRGFWLAHPPVPCERTEKPQKTVLSDDARRMLVLLENKPGLAAMEYFAELGWAPATGSRIKKKLEELGCIRSHVLAGGRRGGSVQAIELLPPGYEKIGLSPDEKHVKGSFAHRWWAYRVKRWLETKGHE